MSKMNNKLKHSAFAGTVDGLSKALSEWSQTNAPSVKLTKGRIKSVTPQTIEIEFRATAGSTSATVQLKGPTRDFLSQDSVAQYHEQLVEIYSYQLARLLTREEYSINYKLLSQYEFRRKGIEWVPNQTGLLCRFCDRKEPDVTFDHKAHAVANMFGNAALMTKSECDECNDHFGKTIENDLGNFTHTARVFSRVPGRYGVPSLHDEKKRWTIDVVNDVMQIQTDEGLDIFSFSDDRKTITSVVPGKKVNPVGALKALTKFALSIMPDAEFAEFKDVAHWVRCEDHTKNIEGRNPLVFVSFFEQIHPTGGAMLLKRSSSNLEYPAMSFVLIFGHHHFQCFLPSKPSEHAAQIKAMPHSFIADYQPKNVTARNFGAAERVQMSPSTVSIRVEGDVVKV